MEQKTNRRHFLRNSATFIGGFIVCPVVLYAQQNVGQTGSGTGTGTGFGTQSGTATDTGTSTTTGAGTGTGTQTQTPLNFDPNNPTGAPQQTRIMYSVDTTRTGITYGGVFNDAGNYGTRF